MTPRVSRALVAFVLLATGWLTAGCAAPFVPASAGDVLSLVASAEIVEWRSLEDRDLGVHLAGTSETNGRREPFEMWLAPDGRYRLRVDGALGSDEVFDGTTVVRRDFSGLTEPLEGSEAKGAPRLAWLLTGGWARDVVAVRGFDEVRARRGANTLEASLRSPLLDERLSATVSYQSSSAEVQLELDPKTRTLRSARALDARGEVQGGTLVFEGWHWLVVPDVPPLPYPLPPSNEALAERAASEAEARREPCSDPRCPVESNGLAHLRDGTSAAGQPVAGHVDAALFGADDAVLVPTAFATYAARTGELESRFEVATATLVSLADVDLEARQVPPSDMHFSGAAPVRVPLRRLATGHLAVPVSIDGGEPKVFLFDTGAGATVLDRAFADELALEHLGDVDAVGVSGSASAAFMRAQALTVGGPSFAGLEAFEGEQVSDTSFTWESPVFVVLDFGAIAEALGAPVVGVLGSDFIARCQVELDADALRLWPYGAEIEASEGWHTVALAIVDRVPSAWATFPTQQGEVGGWFRIDTGDNGSVTFHGPAIEEHGLLAGRETSPISFGGVGGSSFGYVAEFEWLELGDLRVGPLEAGFAIQAEGTFGQSDLAGNIGQGILGRYDVRLDYSRRQMALRERVVEGEPSE